jgi:fibronectin type 3 domain-containing protein
MGKRNKPAVLEWLEPRILFAAAPAGLAPAGLSATSATPSTCRYRIEGQAWARGVTVPSGSNSGMSAAQTYFDLLRRTQPDAVLAPTNLQATPQDAGIELAWTNQDAQAQAVSVLRSTDGGSTFKIVARLAGDAASYLDTSAVHGRRYYYQVQACLELTPSALSNTVSAALQLKAPSDLTATLSGNAVNLQWVGHDAAADGYKILRSSDGVNFYEVGRVASVNVLTYRDSAVFAGQTYQYKVVAYDLEATSETSNTAAATTPAAPSTSISTRYDYYASELVINATGTQDVIRVTQNGSILTITINGQDYLRQAPVAGLFIYTRGGHDTVTIDSSVTLRTTVETIDYAQTSITSGGADVVVWMDDTDAFSGTGVVRRVAGFLGGVSRGYQASLANPSDLRIPFQPNESLWGNGPVADDVIQGGAGDCYYLGGLAAMANANPHMLRDTAVDMGDGTYVIRCFRVGLDPVYVRVSNLLDMGRAQVGTSHTVWALVMEKAFCYIRGGQNTYASLWGGFELEAFLEVTGNYSTFTPSSYDDAGLYTKLSDLLSAGQGVALSSGGQGGLLPDHTYTLIRLYQDGAGVRHYVVRNPWGPGHVGLNLEDLSGYADLTYAQFVANFYQGSMG